MSRCRFRSLSCPGDSKLLRQVFSTMFCPLVGSLFCRHHIWGLQILSEPPYQQDGSHEPNLPILRLLPQPTVFPRCNTPTISRSPTPPHSLTPTVRAKEPSPPDIYFPFCDVGEKVRYFFLSVDEEFIFIKDS